MCDAWGKGKIKTNGSVVVVVTMMCSRWLIHSIHDEWMDGSTVVVEPSLVLPSECSLRDLRVFDCMSVLLAKTLLLTKQKKSIGSISNRVLCLFSFHAPVLVLQQETRC